jgi:outer membrane receptor protein involved in Fe transport
MSDEAILDPIVVSADFRDANLSQTSNAVSVIGEDELYDKASQSFIQTLSATPNLNFASGASKAKYIQIRGIGERSQYETPMNPSVGVMVDGIDFSQLTLGLTSFDTKQVEILKGPQGTLFGTNAIAGVIALESNEPTEETEGHIETTVGNYNTKAIGAAVGGKISENLLGRISVYKNTSDGYIKNWTPDTGTRKDTNNIDELVIKSKLKWLVSDNHTIDFTFMHVNVDNGYDGWTFDNSRTTYSDQPGTDAQKTDAFAIQSTYQISPKMHLVTKVSHSDSASEYSYDVDWSYDGQFIYGYNYFDQYLRDQKQTDLDVRLVSDEDGKIFNNTTSWTLGTYYRDQNEDFQRNYTGLYSAYNADYTTDTKAIYGQLDTALTDSLVLTTGLRLEKWKANYDAAGYYDSNNTDYKDPYSSQTDDVLKGGKIGLAYTSEANDLYYINLAKGYKPGGFNINGPDLDADQKNYLTETLWNLESGVNSSYLNGKLKSRFNLFYGERKDIQVKQYLTESDPNTGGVTDYTEFMSNAAKAKYYGLESRLDYYPSDKLHVYASLGLLKTKFGHYEFSRDLNLDDIITTDIDLNGDGIITEIDSEYFNMSGRETANSPLYQYSIGLAYNLGSNWIFKANMEGKDEYYFSDGHNQKSRSYNLVNSSLEYVQDQFAVSLWGRNLTNKEYDVRGFGDFGNTPNDYYLDRYVQLGAPRTFGVTLSYDF